MKGQLAQLPWLAGGLAVVLAMLAAACGGAPPAAPPPTAGATLQPAIPTAIPPTDLPTEPPTSIPAPTMEPTATPPSRALRAVQPGETLTMLGEITVLRSDFGLRSAFAPGGPVLYHTGAGTQILGDDYLSGTTVLQLSPFPQGAPHVVEVSPDGTLLVAEDGPSLGVWHLPDGASVARLAMPSIFPAQFGGFIGEDAFFAADLSGNAVLWDARTWEERFRLSTGDQVDAALALPADAGVVMLLREDIALTVTDWDGAAVRRVPLPAAPWQLLGLSPDGRRAALHVDQGKGTEGLLLIALDDPSQTVRVPLLNIRGTAIADDWSVLAVTDAGETLYLFDPQSGAPLYSQPLSGLQVVGLSLSTDGALLAVHLRQAGSNAGSIQIWARDLSGRDLSGRDLP